MNINDNQQVIPPLVPYNKKKHQTQTALTPKPILVEKKKPEENNNNSIVVFGDKQLVQSESDKDEDKDSKQIIRPSVNFNIMPVVKDIPSSKLDQIRKNRTSQRAAKIQRQIVPIQQITQRQSHGNNKMINKINQMINKTAAKNVADQIIPISIQAINKNIVKLRKQISELEFKAQEIQNQIQNNQHNAVLQKQKKNIEKQIEQLSNLIGLYFDKIETRQETKNLIEIIQQLKQQHKVFKQKAEKDAEKYLHPASEREKNLKIELEKTKKQLQKQRKMRQQFENKINDTIQDFMRLYDQADVARKIIVAKLKEIHINEEELAQQFMNSNRPLPSRLTLNRNKIKDLEESNQFQSGNFSKHSTPLIGNISSSRPIDTDRQKQFTQRQRQKKSDNNTLRRTPLSLTPTKQMSMQQKINRMRGNQATFKKMKI